MAKIKVWNQELFVETTRVCAMDTFLTNGVSATYPFTNKPDADVGSTIEYSSVSKNLYNGGFVKNGDGTITINTVPASGLKGVIPGVRGIAFDSYDTDSVDGVVNPRQCVTHFWIGVDPSDIVNFKFVPKPGASAINTYFVDNIPTVGPDTTWYQLAACNASSVPGAYAATGASIGIPSFSASATLSASSASGSFSLTVSGTGTSPDAFLVADYIVINPGQPSSEIARIVDIPNSTTLTLRSGLSSIHNSGENVYVFCREYAALETTPSGATGGTSETFLDMSLQIDADSIQRI